MSNEYLYTTSDELSTEKRSSGKIEKGLKKLLFIIAIIIAAQLIWLFGISPFIPFSSIEIHGSADIHREEILSLAGLNENSSFVSTNAAEIQDKISRHILVESVIVMKNFPDKLSIFINMREAAAVTIMKVNSGQFPLLIDRNGVLFKIGNVDSKETINLPLISGLVNPQLNMRLPDSLISLVKKLSVMSVTSPELLSAFSEIRIEPKIWEGYDYVLFPVHSSIRVRVDENLSEETLRYMLLLLNVLERSDEKPEEIDLRSGIGSYKVKEKSL